MTDAAPARSRTWSERTANGAFAFRRAFREFLTLPLLIMLAFFVLGVVLYALDQSSQASNGFYAFFKSHIFNSSQAARDLLGIMATGVLTITSITITVPLLIVQQSAATMSSQVYDQFLRRRYNQFYFGYFVALGFYNLFMMATAADPFVPVYGGTAALLLTLGGLVLLLLLVYAIIDQMRPSIIARSIHDRILDARTYQLKMVCRTRRATQYDGNVSFTLTTEWHGFVVNVDVDKIAEAGKRTGQPYEVVLLHSVGTFLATGDAYAIVKAESLEAAQHIAEGVRAGVEVEHERDINHDPAYGIEQLATVAWTSTSSSKGDPNPGLLTIRMLRDLTARWAAEPVPYPDEPLPIVYFDNTFTELLDSFESLIVVSSQSLQYQIFAEVMNAFAHIFLRLPSKFQDHVDDVIRRSLEPLSQHILTHALERALEHLVETLERANRIETAKAVKAAHRELRAPVAKIEAEQEQNDENPHSLNGKRPHSITA